MIPSKVTVMILVIACSLHNCDSDGDHHHPPPSTGYSAEHALDTATLAQIALHLDKSMYGNAYARGTPEYEHRRAVHNGACVHIYPAIIAVPHNTEDVSKAVKTAVQYGLPVSFRSGGHSFICQGIREVSKDLTVTIG